MHPARPVTGIMIEQQKARVVSRLTDRFMAKTLYLIEARAKAEYTYPSCHQRIPRGSLHFRYDPNLSLLDGAIRSAALGESGPASAP